MSAALNLAAWIRSNYRNREPLTHLKLQKLAFYCYGAVVGQVRAPRIGEIVFEAWAHGPVSREIWDEFKTYRGEPIPKLPRQESPRYDGETESALRDALAVYGPISAWSLRQESHLEAPWREAWKSGRASDDRTIAPEVLRTYFAKKFRRGNVRCPEHLAPFASFALDRIPVRAFETLHDLAEAVTHDPATT